MNCKMSIMAGKYIASSEDEFWQCKQFRLLVLSTDVPTLGTNSSYNKELNRLDVLYSEN